MVTFRAALVVSALLSTALSVRMVSVTPLAKVISLLEQIESEITAEGTAEAASYDTFAWFCKNKTGMVSGSIITGKDNIDSLSATMNDKSAEKSNKETDLSDRTARQESLNTDLADTNARCSQEAADYEASNADLTKAIQSLVDATNAINNSRSSGNPSSAGLLTVKQSVKKSLALAEALKIISDGPKWGAVTAFLQESVDPDDPSYRFHSQPVLDIMSQLETEFRTSKSDADAAYSTAHAACNNTVHDLTNQISDNTNAMTELDTDISGLTTLLATTRSDIVQAESTLKDDQLYMTDLTALCEKRASQWDQRSHLRANELTTISSALDILRNNVTSAEVVNRRAFTQVRSSRRMAEAQPAGGSGTGASSVSFLQGGLESKHRSGSTGLLRGGGRNMEAHASSQHQRQLLGKAMALLRREGSRLGSTSLSSLAARASADPFLKVKTLLQKLIERLLKEATAEASKKGFCDTDLSKAMQDRTFRYEETLKLNSELRTLAAKKQQLELEIGDLSSAKQALETALENATSIRGEEKQSNLADVRTANDGLHAVTEAIMILKTFYKEAAKATALVQKASPVEEDNPGAGFDGAYRGKQQSSEGIIGLLEVIKSDFSRTVRTTTQAEEEAAASFVEFDRASRADISGKDTKVTLDTEDLSTTNSTIQTKMQDMQSNMDLVDTALREVEALKPMCIDSGMSYADRVEKREREVEALRRAFCILDEDGVESTLCGQWGY